MTDAAQLREAVAYPYQSDACGEYEMKPAIFQAAQTLLTLLEAHGDGIQGLIDGTHWIAPKYLEANDKMWQAGRDTLGMMKDNSYGVQISYAWQNIRNAKEG